MSPRMRRRFGTVCASLLLAGCAGSGAMTPAGSGGSGAGTAGTTGGAGSPGSAGSGGPGGMTGAGGAGRGGGAGTAAAGAGGAGGIGGAANPCASRPGLLFCDDFESKVVGTFATAAPWVLQGGSVTIDGTTPAHSGNKSVHVHAGDN